MVEIWQVLGIAPTGDARLIKKAYAARLKHANPEDDPQAFQRLRQAYEAALDFARWQQAQREPPGVAARPRHEGPPEATGEPGRPPTHAAHRLRPREDASTVEATVLLQQAERLCDHPQTRVSEAAWRTLLASEALWNVDTRQRFSRSLLELVLHRGGALAPSVLHLLDEELRWSEEALVLYRSLPRQAVDWLLQRIAQAPLEHARQLCDDGRYEEARPLLERVLSDRASDEERIGEARRLLARAASANAAARVMDEVHRLRADERAWRSVHEWRAILRHEALRDGDARNAFQRQLFEFLVRDGRGLGGPAWQLLNATYRWAQELPPAEFQRAAAALGPAMVEAIEGLYEQARYREVVAQWARLVERVDGEAGERGRVVFERSCLASVEAAELLQRGGRHREAVEEASPAAEGAPGELAARARSVLDGAGRALLERARRLHDARQHRMAIEELAPVRARLKGELAQEARLLLARCYLEVRSPRKAEHCLKEVLHEHPRHVAAHLLLAEALRADGRADRALEVFEHVLQLDPGNEQAARGAEAMTRLLAPPPPAADPAPAAPAETGPAFPWWFFLLGLYGLRSCGRGDFKVDSSVFPLLLGFLAILGVTGGLLAVVQHWIRRAEPDASLRSHPDASRSWRERLRRWARALGSRPVLGFVAQAAIVIGGIGLLILLVQWDPGPRASQTPAPNAMALRDQGMAALSAGHYDRAVTLFQSAAASQPSLPDVYEGLGRALHELGRGDEALAAFTRQVEQSPRHPRAYAWRAHVNIAANRWDAAETDLLKQIAVAPALPWSYTQLAGHRMAQRRFGEATKLYARAASNQPGQAERWLDLATAQSIAGKAEEARTSLDKAMALQPEDWMQVTAARTYYRLGDMARAGEIAHSALPPLRQRLDGLSPDRFGERDLYWVDRLAEAWTIVGKSASASGDAREAERYLAAAWQLGRSPEAAMALAELRTLQGRTREAEAFRMMSFASIDSSFRHEAAPRLEAARAAVGPTGDEPMLEARAALAKLQRVRLIGSAPGELTEDVLLLADAQGRVVRVKRRDGGDVTGLRLEPGALRLDSPRPGVESSAIVRQGRLVCKSGFGCSLELPPRFAGVVPLPSARESTATLVSAGEVRILDLGPTEGLPLRPGQRVTLHATIQYEVRAAGGRLRLVAQGYPAGRSTEVASAIVGAKTGKLTLRGDYTVPPGAARIDVLVQLLQDTSGRPALASNGGFFAVASGS